VTYVPARRDYRAGESLRRTHTLLAQLERAAQHGQWPVRHRALLRSLIAEAREELHALDTAICLPVDD
jgi:hypothetical protein